MTLREAALKLLDVNLLPDEFDDYEEGAPLRADMVMRQVSIAAGELIESEFGYDNRPPAYVWENAPIADCKRECERLAGKVVPS